MKESNFDKFCGCLIGGAIGDCVGGFYENQRNPIVDKEYGFDWEFSDDTQMTLATCEGLIEAQGKINPELIAKRFVYWYNNRKITGIGSSTLKALRELQLGQHWLYSGNRSEFAAGNGAAMRIAPLAFIDNDSKDRESIYDVCRITHKNDEAYMGALSVIIAIENSIEDKEEKDLIKSIVPMLADTNIRDRFISISEEPSGITIKEIAKKYGCKGYVVESVPLAVFAATQAYKFDLRTIFEQLIECGGDTDTNCSIAGQIIGSKIGLSQLPNDLVLRLKKINDYCIMDKIINEWKNGIST